MSSADKEKTFFAVWLINCVADAWGCAAREVYRDLQTANIVNEYVIPLYPVLHTMGRGALVDEITCLAKKRGVR